MDTVDPVSLAEAMVEVMSDLDDIHRKNSIELQRLFFHLDISTQCGKLNVDDSSVTALCFTENSVEAFLSLLDGRTGSFVPTSDNPIDPLKLQMQHVITALKEQDVTASLSRIVTDNKGESKVEWCVAVPHHYFGQLMGIALKSLDIETTTTTTKGDS